MTVSEVSISDQRAALLAALLDEQRPRAALVAAAMAALFAAALWVGLALAFAERTQLHAAFIGVLVGFAVRNWGLGIERRYSLIGLTFTFLALVLGSVLSEFVLFAQQTRREDFLVFLDQFLTARSAFKLASDNLAADGFLFWTIGLVLGYRQSRRRITRAMLEARRADR